MRTSSYSIIVRIPDDEDSVLLAHGYTGAFDRVSRNVAEFLRRSATDAAGQPRYGQWREQPEPARLDGEAAPADALDPETLRLLAKRGYITTRTADEERALVARLVERHHRRSSGASYVFMPTYQCNLRCHYCFQDHMRTDPRYAHLLARMTPELVDRIFAAMPDLEARHPEAPAPSSLKFFGGEPLLAENREIVEYIMGRARERGIDTFDAVSNATELDAYAGLLGPGGISALQVTLDGPPAEHDTRRIYADGSGSFARIADNLTMAMERGVRISVRVNVDRANLASLVPLAEELTRRGWVGKPEFSAYASPITPTPNTDSSRLMNRAELTRALLDATVEHPVLAAISAPTEDLVQGLSQVVNGQVDSMNLFRSSFCGAHRGMYIFDPLGDIYTCWDLTGDASIRVGRVDEHGRAVLNGGGNNGSAPRGPVRLPVVGSVPNRVEVWQERTFLANKACSRCRYAFYCGGGCAALALEAKDDFNANYCDGLQRTFKEGLLRAYDVRGEQRA